MPDERSKEKDTISFSKLTEESLHTMCRVKMDNGSIARHNLYWVYRNEPYLFEKLVEQGDVSHLTGYLYEISEDLFDKYMLPFLSDGDEPLLIDYIRSHYNQLLEDYKMEQSIKGKKKEQQRKIEEVHKPSIRRPCYVCGSEWPSHCMIPKCNGYRLIKKEVNNPHLTPSGV